MDECELGLADLFSIQDYQQETIVIPRRRRSNKEGEVAAVDISIELFHSVAAATDPDLTGQVLWPVSRLLSLYLAHRMNPLQGTSVLELGAGGTALPSLTAAHCGASRVVATDGNDGPVLDLLQRNIQHQQSQLPQGVLSCRQLLWGSRKHVQALREENHQRPFDIVVAADVVQWPAVLEPLLQTVVAALWRNDEDRLASTTTPPVVLLGIVERSTAVQAQFVQLAEQMGFVIREIDPAEYLPEGDGVIPPSCQEYGGRTAKLWELTLVQNSGSEEIPLLLQQNDTEDFLVGASYKNTMFLPC